MKTVQTARLLIRRFKEGDAADLYGYLSDKEVVKYEPYEVATKEECEKIACQRANNEAFFAICLKESGKVIGNLYFEEQEFQTYEIGFVLNKAYQKQGYAVEATEALIQTAFKEWGTRRIVAMCNPKNEASWKLLEKLKMRREGHLIQNIWFKEDEQGEPIWQDTYEYGLLKEEWE